MLFLPNTPPLNDLDYVIYRYITKNIDSISQTSIRELADKTHTSTASVLRFCKKFECTGFSEFKVRLKLWQKSNIKVSSLNSDPSEYIEFLTRSTDETFQSKINKAAKLLLKKELVLFLGAGTSETIAAYGALYFTNLSIPSLKISDPSNYSPDWFTPKMLSQTGFIILSISGETEEILEYVNHLTTNNARIISITNSNNSRLAQAANINIAYHITRETVSKNSHPSEKMVELTSQIPAIFTIESLAKRINFLKNNSKQSEKKSTD